MKGSAVRIRASASLDQAIRGMKEAPEGASISSLDRIWTAGYMPPRAAERILGRGRKGQGVRLATPPTT
jgi:hypothetical protein